MTDDAILTVLRSRLRWWTPGEIARILDGDRWQIREHLEYLTVAGQVTAWDVTPHQTLWGINGRPR